MFRSWWQKFFTFPRSRFARRRGYRPPLALRVRTTRLSMTALEDRITPAFNMTLSDNPTVGVTESTVGSTATFTATATGANLQFQDIQNALALSDNVVVNSGSTGSEAGNITDQTGNQFSGLPGNQTLTFQSGTGTGLVGNITIEDINLAGANESISIKAQGSVTTGELTAGSFFAPTALASSTITAVNGSISEGGPFQGPIFATNLALSAATGIGTAGTPLPTQASNLEAKTAAGGIFITNNAGTSGTLNIVGAGTATTPDGVVVTGSGDIQLINNGSIDVTTNFDVIRSPGNITVQALGATADVQNGGQDGTFNAIRSTGTGDVSVTAGQDILMGNAGGFGSIVSAGGGTSVNAGRDLIIDSGSRLSADGGTSDVTATAGRNITLQATSGTGAQVTNSGSGKIALTTGAGGVFTLNSLVGGIVQSTGGAITISADDMVINDPINAGAGIVTLQQAGTTARPIDLGLGTTANTLGLSDLELAQVTTGVLRIGRSDNAGTITVTAPVLVLPGFSTLSLISGGAVTESGPTDTITVTNLAVRAATGINLNTVVSNLAVRNTTSGNVNITNTGATTLTTVDTLNGSAGNQQGNFGGGTTFTASSPFTYAITYTGSGTITTVTTDDGPIDTDNITVDPGVTVESTGGDIEFEAGDDIVIDATATVKSDTGNIDFRSGFQDTDSEGIMTLDGTLSAGGTVTLNVLVTNSTAPAGVNGVTEGAAGTITANGLLLLDFPNPASARPFVLNASTTNAVGTIAADTVAAISYRDSGALTIGTVSAPDESLAVGGIFTNNNAVNIVAVGTITLNAEVSAGTAAATLDSTGGSITETSANQAIFPGVIGGAITLTAGGAGGMNLAVDTTTPATAGVTATTTNAPISLFSTQQLQVDNINAGTGDVTLHVTSPTTTASSITSLHPNDNAADVTGGTVTLTADGATTGNTGQIGSFSGSAQFFEVAATTLNASTNNSRLWISAIGGTAIGSVNAGTNTAFLRTYNGTLTSTHTGTTPDVTAAAINLSQSPAAATGAFGTAANPLLVQTATLTANITAGPGSINVTNVPAGGNLAVVSAKTLTGPINLSVTGGNLTTTATTGIDILAPASTITLNASGAVLSGTPAGVTDASAGNLAITAGSGIGSAANPFKTVVTNLAFDNTGGSVTLVNTGGLTINAVGNLLTSSNTGTTTTLTATSPMTFAVNTTSAGTLTATTTDDNVSHVDNIAVNSGVTVESTGGDVVFDAGDDDVINGTVESTFRDVDLVAGFGDTDGEGVISIDGTVSAVATVALNVNAANAVLPAGTDIVTETAASTITAAGLLLLNFNAGATGPISLDASTTNSVGTIAATTNAVINFRDSSALTVGAVTSTPEGVTSLGILTSNHDATLCTVAGDISLTQALNVGTGTARLQSGGAVSQNATGKITAADLGVNATGNIGLDQAANAVPGTIALNSTGGSIAFMDADGFTIGTVAASGCFTGASGITGTGDITLCSGAAIIVAAPLDTTGTVRLQAGGSVTQTAAGTITAGNLGVRANGNIGLCVIGSANAVTGAVAADASGGPAGSSVMFLDADGFTVGTITASGCFTANAVGVKTNNGDADLVSTAGPIILAQAVNAGTGTVRIDSGGSDATGSVYQSAAGAGAITAQNLGVVAHGNVDLCLTANTITSAAFTGNVAIHDLTAGTSVMFLDSAGFTVGTVAGDSCVSTADPANFPLGGISGVTTVNGDIDLVSQSNPPSATPGPIRLAQVVNAGTGTVRINAGGLGGSNANGSVYQTGVGAGAITAQSLAVVANGIVDLCQTANTIAGTFAASDATAGASVMFLDGLGFTVGTVAADSCAAGATGVVTNNGDVDLVSTAGPIVLAQAVNAGTGTARIDSGGSDATGSVYQTAAGAGAITAQNLGVVAHGTVNLCLTANTITNATFTGNVAIHDLTAGASVMFLDSAGFTVGTVAGDSCVSTADPTNFPLAGISGVTTVNGDIDLVSAAGPIRLAQSINAGTGTVRLDSGGADATGSVYQTAAGAGSITAQNVGVVAHGNVDLCLTANTITSAAFTGNVAIHDLTEGASVMFLDSAGFTVGTVVGDSCVSTADPTNFPLAGISGVTTVNGDVDLVSAAGPIRLAQVLNAGTGTVRLDSGGADATGSVYQTAAGAGSITAQNLGVVAHGTVNLCLTANTITSAAFTGNVAIHDLTAGTSVMFLDSAGFTVGTVAGDSCVSTADPTNFPLAGISGVTTVNGDIDLVSAAGPIRLAQVLNAGTGTVRLDSGGADATGSVYQTAAGAGSITAQNLGVVAHGNVDLCLTANTITSAAFTGNVAIHDLTAGASVMFLDSAGFTVGMVAGDSCVSTADPANFPLGGISGVTTVNGDIDLVSQSNPPSAAPGPIRLAQVVNAGTGTVRINAGGLGGSDPNGSVYQTVGGVGAITAQNLAVVANGAVDLCEVPNTITGSIAALDNTLSAPIMFEDTAGFAVDTVPGDACASGASGVITNNGDVDLVSTAGPIVLTQKVDTTAGGMTPSTATVRINSGGTDATGSVYQTKPVNGGVGAITAQNLAVVANGAVDLCEVPNTITGSIAALDNTLSAPVMFKDTAGFTVGTVAGDACASGASGVITNNGDVDLVSTAGPIVLTQKVDTTAGGMTPSTATVRINSGGTDATGSVYQTKPVNGGVGAITAQNLAVVANGAVDLCEVPNTITGSFAALDNTLSAPVMFKDTAGFTVGTVAGDACAAGATGVVTNNGDIDLVSTTGPVILTEPVNAGTGTVRINSGGADATGSVYQLGGGKGGAGVVTAANLAVVANGAVDLSQLANDVTGNVAVTDSGAGAPVRFLDTPGFTVGTVAADSCAAGATGVMTSNGLATLVSNTGAIQVQQAINLGSGIDRLQAATGISSTAATGTITAAALGVRNTTSGDIQLDQANVVPVFSAVNNAAGAGINFRTTGALSLDAVSADGTLFAALNNVTTTGTGGTVRLQAAGLSQTVNGIVTTDLLGVENTAGNVILDQPNAVNTFAAGNTTAGGRITLADANGLVLGTVGAQGTFAAVNGITTNAGTTYLQAAGNVTQTAAGLVNSQALAVGSSAGGTIRLDQGNTVATFAADEATAGGLINLRTTSGLTIDTVTSGSALLAPIAGLTTNTGTALLHAANGITQTAAGLIDSATLALRNDTSGDISLLQTNYVTHVGNQVGKFAAANGAAGGRLDFATLGALTLGTVAGDGTFAQVRGLTTNNGESNIRTGTDFTAVDTNYASPLISLGSGNFLLNPGLTGDSVVTFNAEAQTTGTFRLGQRNSTAPEPQAPGVTDLTNPAGTPGTDNVHADTFNVRPSDNVMILVNGNQPPPGPGKDTLNLILTSVPVTTQITFTPGGTGAGRFDFTGGPGTPKPLAYTGIESVGGRGIVAAATQTGPTTYSITAAATIFGRVLTGGLNGGQVPSNPFIVSPNPVNPTAPFGAPRLAVGDFNGDDVPDLIIGNGPDNSPLVTVVNGNNLFGAPHALGSQSGDILSQFFAYNQNFQGGMYVAAGDLDGDGRTEIVTGADAGGGPHVRIFAFNPAPGLTAFNNVVDDAAAHPGVSAFPAGGFYAYNAGFTGGVRVAVADVNGDGRDDIITGAGAGGGPHVRVFSGATGQVIDSFYAYASNFTGGVYVAGGDYNGDGKADIITGSGAGGPHIRVFSGTNLNVLASFYAFGVDGNSSLFGADLGNTSGVGSVAYGNNMDVQGNTQPIIIVGSARGPITRIAVFQGNAKTPPTTPPTIKFTAVTNPFPSLYTVDTTAVDPLDLDDLISIPPLRDGTNVAGEAF